MNSIDINRIIDFFYILIHSFINTYCIDKLV